MKKIFYILILLGLSVSLNSCIKETFPTEYATTGQIAKSAAALEALANSTAAYMNAYNVWGAGYQNDFGYASCMMARDAMTGDYPNYNSGYDYFSGWGTTTSIGENSSRHGPIWYFYYKLINNAHSIIGAVDPENATTTAKQFLGCALVFRALVYLDLTRMYEYKLTGVPALDEKYADIKGLTVPIVLEDTKEEDARNNPRVPFYHMYRFIMNDLENAEKYIDGYVRTSKGSPDITVVYALKARLWLEMATRFRKYPEDLTTLLSHENDEDLAHYVKLNITSATDCYANAKSYAQKAMAGYTPLTKAQWHDPINGFTSSTSQNSWLFGIIIGENGVKHNYINFIGQISPETTFGTAQPRYTSYRAIDKNLFDEIRDNDWRKTTWIDPADQGGTPGTKYSTLLDDATWKTIPAYVNFKFRPNAGDMTAWRIGAATDLPVIRVEEMYFIEAEAEAYLSGVQAGIDALELFMNTYRMTDASYTCGNILAEQDFVEELIRQKRIEFWGEGISYFDIKRLELPVLRGYQGTNYLATYRINSILGYVAPWMNIVINYYEIDRNGGIVNNPDPSKAIDVWE